MDWEAGGENKKYETAEKIQVFFFLRSIAFTFSTNFERLF
jgi:hypothetical protein